MTKQFTETKDSSRLEDGDCRFWLSHTAIWMQEGQVEVVEDSVKWEGDTVTFRGMIVAWKDIVDSMAYCELPERHIPAMEAVNKTLSDLMVMIEDKKGPKADNLKLMAEIEDVNGKSVVSLLSVVYESEKTGAQSIYLTGIEEELMVGLQTVIDTVAESIKSDIEMCWKNNKEWHEAGCPQGWETPNMNL